jgi:hypothetical protein
LSSSSSSSDSSDPSRAAAERIESKDAEADAAEAVSGLDDFAANISFVDKSAALSTSSGEEGMVAGTSACENHDPRVKWASKCDPTDNGSTL